MGWLELVAKLEKPCEKDACVADWLELVNSMLELCERETCVLWLVEDTLDEGLVIQVLVLLG